MRVTIPTKLRRAEVSMMIKGCNGTCILPLRCFLFLLPNYIHVYAVIMHYFSLY